MQESGIKPFTMPLMTLAATAIDQVGMSDCFDPIRPAERCLRKQCSYRARCSYVQPKPRERVIETLLQYLHTDSACCREEPGAVADRQAEVLQFFVPTAKLLASCASVPKHAPDIRDTHVICASMLRSRCLTQCFAGQRGS